MDRITYDEDAMRDRTAALMDFLDLYLHEWEAWVAGDAPDRLPQELHPPIVSIIESLRAQEKGGDALALEVARGDYMQAITQLTTDVMRVLRKEVRP
jgi:hypothetical protein